VYLKEFFLLTAVYRSIKADEVTVPFLLLSEIFSRLWLWQLLLLVRWVSFHDFGSGTSTVSVRLLQWCTLCVWTLIPVKLARFQQLIITWHVMYIYSILTWYAALWCTGTRFTLENLSIS